MTNPDIRVGTVHRPTKPSSDYYGVPCECNGGPDCACPDCDHLDCAIRQAQKKYDEEEWGE